MDTAESTSIPEFHRVAVRLPTFWTDRPAVWFAQGHRTRFCQEMLDLIAEDEDLVNNFCVSDEAHFYVSGFVNKQNFRYRSQANPRALHVNPLHSPKVTVWCAMSASGIIGPTFFRIRLAMQLLLMRKAMWKCCKNLPFSCD